MKMLTYDTLASDFPRAWAAIATQGEEVVVTHHRRRVASIVPEPPPATALDVFGDLHGVLGEGAGAAVATTLAIARDGKRSRGSLQELRNPWAS